MIPSLKDHLFHSEPFRLLEKALSRVAEKPVFITGVSGSLMAFVTARASERISRLLIIVPDRDHAEQLRDDCILVGEGRGTGLYVHADHHASTLMDMSRPVARIEALQSLARKEEGILIASAEAIAGPIPGPAALRSQTSQLAIGQEYPFQLFLNQLMAWGFERKDFVEGYGDVAVRGGIVDVFPFVGEHPLRLEFWGDKLESIREFDAASQRSIRELSAATITANISPAPESGKLVSLFQHLPPDTLIVVDEPLLCERTIVELMQEGVQGLFSWPQLKSELQQFPSLVHSNLEQQASTNIRFGSSPQPPFHGSVRVLVEHLQQPHLRSFAQVIACDTEEEQERIGDLISEEIDRQRKDEENSAPWSGPTIMSEALHHGFVFPAASMLLYTEHETFGRLKRRGTKRKPRFKGFSQRDLFRLNKGDYVVHTEFGVGRFAGLQTIKVRGLDQEVMKIVYDESDVLYVHLHAVNRVQKYSSQEGHEPKLTKLGTPQWERLKAKARKRIKDIARELIRLYALRKHKPGHAFSPDSHWQKEMEASFMYEDTPDQAKATDAVKADMQEPVPMERLICGDVGFGKTEVAIRAAFKAALDGKQVAVLVPTTILAHQHHQTFLDRLGRYTVKVESLTRFKSASEQRTIVEGLKAGTVDIIIGTHRLLSKDVAFKDLGLLVVDEEHRFGVTAKERLRQLSASVDTLMLTATPIPRTLQFSLMGARDLSIINTPPRNRLPIETEIAVFDPALIREVILREMHRGGQVYFIHDRIHTMDDIMRMLQKVVPEARIHSAHGQMKGHELEKTMVAFLDRAYDVLVCTKIIESGIDIPRVNTIIINRADRFGLAELYQLRGRVGRSNVQAYAYLLTPPLSSLPRVALQRLQAVQEFTELGSGFNLALRDMEIRGAGNLLGAEQSGFILEMGLEMYQRVVEEAVQEIKEEEFGEDFRRGIPASGQEIESLIECDIEALIPDIYIESDAERLDVYRRLYQARSLEDVNTLGEELKDRFGEKPVEVEQLLEIVKIKVLASLLRFTRVDITGNRVRVTLPDASDESFYKGTEKTPALFQPIMDYVPTRKDIRFHLKQDGRVLRLELTLDPTENRIEQILSILNGCIASAGIVLLNISTLNDETASE